MTAGDGPPRAPARPVRRQVHGETLVDDYAWLRDPGYPKVTDPEILAWLEGENTWFHQVMDPHGDLVDGLWREMRGRMKEDEESYPVGDGGWAYRWRYDPGAQYPVWSRRPAAGGDWSVYLDEAALARDHDYFDLHFHRFAPDERRFAWAADTEGSERYVIRIGDAETGDTLAARFSNTSGSAEWSSAGDTLFHVRLNENLRPFRVLAAPADGGDDDARTVWEETDPGFFVGISRTRSRRFLVIRTGDNVTSELRLLDPDRPEKPPRIVAPRRAGHRYSLDHAGDFLWILTNDTHRNFRIVRAPASDPGEENWQEVVAPSDRRYLVGLDCFDGFNVVTDRVDGQLRLVVMPEDGPEYVIPLPEETCAVGLGANPEFATRRLRLRYSSMITPPSDMDWHVDERRLEILKVREIPSGHDPADYETRRLMAPAADGEQVPVSLVCRRDFPRDGSGPLFLYAYGSYGHGLDPSFSVPRLSLLDRGFAFAIAHVRGGDELGWRWYEDGKLMHKRNSFTDFIACAEHLVASGWTAAGNIAIMGGSAGGALVGAVVNMRPALFRAAIADVPFVDVLNTMLDDSLPLTPMEYPEWGNPLADPEAFRYIRSWSPYDNIGDQAYPHLFVLAGLSDPRVTYWEPAKYVARLRACRQGDNMLLLKTRMEAGHFGATGRWDALRDTAELYAFFLVAFDRAG